MRCCFGKLRQDRRQIGIEAVLRDELDLWLDREALALPCLCEIGVGDHRADD